MWDEEEKLIQNMKEKVSETKSQFKQELIEQQRNRSRGRSKSQCDIQDLIHKKHDL
jgi:hypothetical protein